MPLAGTAAITELWAKVKDGFGRKLSVSPASTTVDVRLGNDAGSTLSTGTIPAATASAAGVLTAADKSKLDGISAGATASAGTITGVTVAGELTGGGTSGAVKIAHVSHLDNSDMVGELSASDYALDWGGSFTNMGLGFNKYGHVTTYGECNVTLPSSVVTGATASAAGAKGLVPAPAAGDQAKWLRGDGTWAAVTPSGIGAAESSHEHSAADITSGTLDTALLRTVSTASNVLLYAQAGAGSAYLVDADALADAYSIITRTLAPLHSPALRGTPTAPTAAAGTSTEQVATTAFVAAAITAAKAGAATFQGTLDKEATLTGASYSKGMYWVVSAAGAYAGQECEVGDMVFAIKDKGSAYAAADFSVVQNNIVEMTAAEVDAICK